MADVINTDLTDNIRVAIRARPFISREINARLDEQWSCQTNSVISRDRFHQFMFDDVFDAKKTTGDLYEGLAKQIVEGAVQGYNGTIFAYGQTSSGKTYTMSGSDKQKGVIEMAVDDIFSLIEEVYTDSIFILRVSCMELYNETVYDLLADKKLEVREKDNNFIVKDVDEKYISYPEEILKFIKAANDKRQVGATAMNDKSSRSHAIYRIVIEGKQAIDEESLIKVSHLNFVDLAGSENCNKSGATGLRLHEGAMINKSLFTLSQVIGQLVENSQHVSYRDSKLTKILKNSLGGNSRTAIICNITTAEKDETLSTLRFASSAKKIRNHAKINEIMSDDCQLKRCQRQIVDLQKQLDEWQTSDDLRLKNELESKEQQLRDRDKLVKDLETKLEGYQRLLVKSSQIPTGIFTPKKHSTFAEKRNRRQTWCPGNIKQAPLNDPRRSEKVNKMVKPIDNTISAIMEQDEDERIESVTNTPESVCDHCKWLKERINQLERELNDKIEELEEVKESFERGHQSFMEYRDFVSIEKKLLLDDDEEVTLNDGEDLQKKISELEEALKEQQSTHAANICEIRDQALNKLEEEKLNMERNYENILKSEQDKYNSRVQIAMEELEDREKELENQRLTFEKAKEELKNNQEILKEREAFVMELENKMADPKHTKTEIEEQNIVEMENLKEEFKQLTEELKYSKDETTNYKSKLSSLEEKFSELKETYEDIESREKLVEELEEKITKEYNMIETKREAVENQTEQLEAAIKDLENRERLVEELENKIEIKLESEEIQKNESESINNDLKSTLENCKVELENTKISLKKAEEELEEKESFKLQYEEKLNEIEDLKTKSTNMKKSYEDELRKLQKIIDKYESEITNFKQEIESLNEKYKESLANIKNSKQTKSDFDRLKVEYENLKKEKSKLDSLKEEIKTKNIEIEEYKKKIKEKEKKIDESKKSNNELEQLRKLKKEYESNKQYLKKVQEEMTDTKAEFDNFKTSSCLKEKEFETEIDKCRSDRLQAEIEFSEIMKLKDNELKTLQDNTRKMEIEFEKEKKTSDELLNNLCNELEQVKEDNANIAEERLQANKIIEELEIVINNLKETEQNLLKANEDLEEKLTFSEQEVEIYRKNTADTDLKEAYKDFVQSHIEKDVEKCVVDQRIATLSEELEKIREESHKNENTIKYLEMDNKRLMDELNKLEDEFNEKEAECDRLLEKTNLGNPYDNQEYDIVKNRSVKLEKEKFDLEQKLESLEKLKSDFRSAKNQCVLLEKENKRLNEKMTQFESLKKQNQEYKLENEQIESAFRSLQKQMRKSVNDKAESSIFQEPSLPSGSSSIESDLRKQLREKTTENDRLKGTLDILEAKYRNFKEQAAKHMDFNERKKLADLLNTPVPSKVKRHKRFFSPSDENDEDDGKMNSTIVPPYSKMIDGPDKINCSQQ